MNSMILNNIISESMYIKLTVVQTYIQEAGRDAEVGPLDEAGERLDARGVRHGEVCEEGEELELFKHRPRFG